MATSRRSDVAWTGQIGLSVGDYLITVSGTKAEIVTTKYCIVLFIFIYTDTET